jgi:hypothetical protein
VLATGTHRRCREKGQALAEYGIILALAAAVGWVQRTSSDLLAQPRYLMIGGAVVAGVIIFFASSGGRR